MAKVSKRKYDILKETFCLYCQKWFASPENLQRHVHRMHPDTYADIGIRRAKDKLIKVHMEEVR